LFKFYIGLIKFDIFKLENDDAYVCSQAPISIEKSIQYTIILEGSIIVVVDLVAIVLANGGEDHDEANKIEKYATTFYNDDN
jgi:hypothetical protein